ncbi:hypothetical protein CesoFtcFv8_020544 [Champsocephalus esox]|uniref:Uncharacterized protein n=1 Tax=Champsocephalus esox TaxID=159716 RepID=A0AAN8BB19_9TELE|nr:hypothetical protein CesoFtcFv8_020544 [Champsocephalus esox]
MDSTKKITKKLSGHAKGTALWVTSIGSSLHASMPQPGVSSALDSAPPDESGAVDDSGMAGMDRVDSLAECLVELRNQLTMVLSNQQVSCSVAEPAGL